MTKPDRERLLEDIRNAAEDFRDAEAWLTETEAEARRSGLSEDEIRDARGLWLR